MRYNNLHENKPEVNDLIWVLDSQLKELLVRYHGVKYGIPVIIDRDHNQVGYHFKFWRNASPEDESLMPQIKKSKGK